MGYRDRTALIDPEVPFDATLFSFGSILSNVVAVDGRVRGAWRRAGLGGPVRLEVRLLAPLAPSEMNAVMAAADRMSRYVGRPVEMVGIQL